MEAGFARALNSAKDFARSAAAVLVAPPRNALGQFTKFGTDAAASVVSALQKTFEQRQAQAFEALARGSITRPQFEQMGTESATAFNTALLNSISKLDAKKTLSPEVRTTLVNGLKEAGIAAGNEFANGFTQVGSKLRSLGRDFTQIGIEASLVLTAPLVAGARKAVDAAEQISKALDRIQVTTGATGASLDSLESSFSRLFRSLPNSADDTARAISGIEVATGATGPKLEALATQVLNLSRITGTELPGNVDSTQRAFKAWGISIDDQVRSLDTLFKVSQATGTTVGSLADSLGHFAPALQQFGLTFSQSAALIGQFQKNGIDADSILTTLQTSLSKFAEKGIDGSHALQLLIDSLKTAGSDADAINLASRIFGPRQAAQIAEAVRNGSLNIQQLTDNVAASATTINDTAKKTDAFGTAMSLLGHTVTDAARPIGETLQRAFVALSPMLTSVASGIGAMATAFASLPPFVTNTLTVVLAAAAAFGPLALVFAGLTKATGAMALAFGILKQGIASTALTTIGTQAATATTGLTAAAGATSSLAAGLNLLGRTALVGVILGAIAFAVNDLTKASREAAQRLDDFKHSLEGLSERQLQIKTDQLRDELAARQKQIDDLRASANPPEGFFSQLGRTIATGDDATGGQTGSQALQAQLESANDATKAQIDATTAAAEAAHKAFVKATADAKAFQDQVNALLQGTGKFVTVDPTGKIHGSLTALKNELAGLQEIASKGIPLPNISTGVLDAAIQHLQTTITQMENKGKAGLGDIFDQLSPSVIALDRQVTALVSKAQNLGGPLAQLSNAKLSASLLTDLASVNRQLEALGDSTSLDAEKLRAMQKALQSTVAAQIGSNVNNSGAFKIDIDGHIKAITVDPDAAAGVVADIAKGLEAVHAAAEQAAAQQLNLERVSATGNLRDIELAGIATQVAYQKARNAEDAFRATVDKSNISIEQQKAALSAMLAEVARTGVAQDKINVAIGLDPDDVSFIANDVRDMLAKLPKPELGLKVFVDQLSLSNAVDTLTATLTRADIQALAGDKIGAQITRQAGIDALAQQFHDLAKTMDLTNPSQGDLDTFFKIQAAASKLGISLDALQQRFEDLSATGKLDRLTAAFASATTAALGTDNAVAKLAEGLASGVDAAIKLSHEIDALSRGGGFDSVIASISSIGNIVGAVGAIGSVLGTLFGPSALDKEHDQILQANNQALKDLKGSLDREAGTAGRIDDLARAISQTTTQAFHDLVAKNSAGGFDVTDPTKAVKDALSTELSQFGLSLDQAEAAAKSLGITLLDSKGNLVGLKAFGDALALEAKIITTLGNDLSTQQKLISVQNAISGKPTTAASTLQDQIDAIAKVAPTIGQTLEAANEQGATALRQALQHLVDGIKAGTIALSDLGGFANVADLLDALGTTADDLNALSSAASSVTDALLNVPAGFKRALTEFNSQLPQAPPGTPTTPIVQPPPPPPTDTTPTRPPDTTGPLLALVHQLLGPQPGSLTASLESSLDKPTDSLTRLSVSASDVADALDRMLGATPTHVGQSSNGVVGSSPLNLFPESASTPARQVVVHEHYNFGDVTVMAKDGQTMEQAFDELKLVVRKRSRQLTGNSMDVLAAFQRG